MAGIPWNEEEEGVLKKMVSIGHGVETICSVLKSRSPASIRSKMDSLGLRLQHDEPEIDYEAFKNLTEGLDDAITV